MPVWALLPAAANLSARSKALSVQCGRHDHRRHRSRRRKTPLRPDRADRRHGYIHQCRRAQDLPTPDLDDSRTSTTLRTNVDGFARLTAAAYRYYRDTANVSQGQIAAITSVAGTKGSAWRQPTARASGSSSRFIDALEQLAYQQQVNVRLHRHPARICRHSPLAGGRDYPTAYDRRQVAPLIETAILRRRRVHTVTAGVRSTHYGEWCRSGYGVISGSTGDSLTARTLSLTGRSTHRHSPLRSNRSICSAATRYPPG